jgi:transposase
VILLSADGLGGAEIAARLDLSPEAVSRIRRRFVQEGVDALSERPKPGRREHAVPPDTIEQKINASGGRGSA